MASLYIKDAATAARVERMARQRGITKTALVGRALEVLDQSEPQSNAQEDKPPADPVAWIKWHRARNPLPPRIGVADKAFYDRMWGEPD